MSKWKQASQFWSNLGITVKFGLAFTLLLILTIFVIVTSLATLTVVQRETDTNIISTNAIQRQILDMDRALEKARRLEKEFFLRYPTIGYSAAYEEYALAAAEQIAQVVTVNTELQQYITDLEIATVWKATDVNMNIYFLAVNRHAASVDEATQLIAQLAADETGLLAQLQGQSVMLLESIQLTDDLDLVILYYEMQSFEKDYLNTRQRPLMQSAFNIAVQLRGAIENSSGLNADEKMDALNHLDEYLALAAEIVEVDVAIQGKFNEFDLQAKAIDPITDKLIVLADLEVERAQERVRQLSQFSSVILMVAAVISLGSTAIIAFTLNNSITRNVIKLKVAMDKLQEGDLDTRAYLDSGDELGQLAAGFNDMGTRLQTLVTNLEEQVAERTLKIEMTNQELSLEIDERKKAEEQIHKLNAELEKRVADRTIQLQAANQELEAFSYSVSHDLRAPLRAMEGFSAALLSKYKDELDEQGQHYLDRIQNSSQRMGHLINDLLNLSRITRSELAHQPVDISDIAREIAAELQMDDPQRQAEFVVAESLIVQGDARLLRIALQNLIGNAWKFSGTRQKARIEVGQTTIADCGLQNIDLPESLKSKIPNLESKVYFVRDNGTGFDMAYADKLFGPFQRLHAMHEFPGTGIGLAIVQRVITRHGGRVWPDAQVDQGATFYFTFGGIQ